MGLDRSILILLLHLISVNKQTGNQFRHPRAHLALVAAAWWSLSGGRWHWHLGIESPSGEVAMFSPSVPIKITGIQEWFKESTYLMFMQMICVVWQTVSLLLLK